ncbi:MAG: GTPase Era [Rhodospirillaceae bacterium]
MSESLGAVQTRCGFVAVIGAPNAGKSTLVNALVGTKVSIVSPRVQTTRTIVRGIAMFGDTQLIFLDTPGIFQAKKRIERAMVAAAWTGAADADALLLVVDAAKEIRAESLSEDNQRIVGDLKKTGRKALLVLNKVDLADKSKLLDLSSQLNATGVFEETFMISALTGDGLERVRDHLVAAVRPGPWLFPEDDISDMPLRLLTAEITREKLFLNLRQELPYSCAVDVESWEEKKDGSLRIDQIIYVTRESHRPIVLGHGGKRLKTIGSASRSELEKILDRRVHLFLHVKVNARWIEDRSFYAAWGLDFDA